MERNEPAAGLAFRPMCDARCKGIVIAWKGHPMAQTLETYTRTISTMSEVLDVLRDEPDPDGAFTLLADRIAVEREWVRALMALGEEPRRPPGWPRSVRQPALLNRSRPSHFRCRC
jgi:hypothetical protein